MNYNISFFHYIENDLVNISSLIYSGNYLSTYLPKVGEHVIIPAVEVDSLIFRGTVISILHDFSNVGKNSVTIRITLEEDRAYCTKCGKLFFCKNHPNNMGGKDERKF